MDTIENSINQRVSTGIRIGWESRSWSLMEFAERTGMSRAVIHKVERGENNPTTTLLGRLSGVFGISMSTLITRAEVQEGKLLRFVDQPVWHDPRSHCLCHYISPRDNLPANPVQIELPAGGDIPIPASSYVQARQLIWLQQGELVFVEEDVRHEIQVGDCLELDLSDDCQFINETTQPCVYLVVRLNHVVS